MTELLLIELNNDVLYLTLNRPEQRNALSLELLGLLTQALEDHRDTQTLKCVIISATGDRCFAAGGDLKEFSAIRSRDEAKAMSQHGRQALDQIRNFPLPVIAALNGPALGGGAELAMACDTRIGDQHAEIGFLQGQLGVTTAWGGGIDLIAALGPGKAQKLLIEGRRLSVAQACDLGLIDRVCRANESLAECVSDFIQPYLCRSHGVLRGFKALSSATRATLHETLSGTEEAYLIETWTHDDHWAAAESALQKK